MPTATQWSKLNEYLLQVCTVHEPVAFCREALRLLPKIVGFDQGIAFFLDENGEVYDTYLIGVDRHFLRAYRDVSLDSEDDDGFEYSVEERARKFAEKMVRTKREKQRSGWVPSNPVYSEDLTKLDHRSRFYREYVRPRGIKYSTGFGLFDDRGRVRVAFSLDRTRNADFSRDELTMLQLAAMHLGNSYANFFCEPPAWHGYATQLDSLDWPLTDRENQILALIMEGKTPKAVAEELGISRETVYKHVSHMHAKLGVTNEAELTARAREELRKAGE